VAKFCISYCTNLNRVLKEAKRQNCSRLRAKSDNKIEARWESMKHEIGNLRLTEESPSLLIMSERTKDPRTMILF
jgi:hypothetical protein